MILYGLITALLLNFTAQFRSVPNGISNEINAFLTLINKEHSYSNGSLTKVTCVYS